MSEEKPEEKRRQIQPVSDEELGRMKRTVPTTESGLFSGFGEETSTVPQVLGGMLGMQNKDVYSIVERTNLPEDEISIVRDLIRMAEHGIGSPVALDRPIPYIAQQVVHYLRLRVSVSNGDGHGRSRQEVENILTQWVARLEAREAELRKQNRPGVAG